MSDEYCPDCGTFIGSGTFEHCPACGANFDDDGDDGDDDREDGVSDCELCFTSL